jgi:DNA-binding NtrC family response regulator
MSGMLSQNLLFPEIVGKSPRLVAALHRVPILSQKGVDVLLLGETGTGKELFAKAIHYHGAGHGGPFVPVNCGALPDQLFESEMFGHTKGAYTDATSYSKGLVAEADGGTLFLDEVNALSQSAQVKLLRFIHDKRYRRLGSPAESEANVRIIAATNAELDKLVAEKQFREDLYFRLKSFTIRIPPLRERMSDLGLLVEHFMDKFCRRHCVGPKSISTEAVHAMMNYSWPGNVRELEGIIHQAVLYTEESVIRRDHLDPAITTNHTEHVSSTLDDVRNAAREVAEREYLINLLLRNGSNMTKTAEAVGRDRRTLQRLVRKHNIDRQNLI